MHAVLVLFWDDRIVFWSDICFIVDERFYTTVRHGYSYWSLSLFFFFFYKKTFVFESKVKRISYKYTKYMIAMRETVQVACSFDICS